MDWLRSMQNAINYMDDNILNEIDYDKIAEWFPTCNYEHADGPEFEMTYDRGNNMYEMEVWIPVVKKAKS